MRTGETDRDHDNILHILNVSFIIKILLTN